MEYDSNYNFVGYVGASEVQFNFIDYLWKLVYTDDQKQGVENFVPTEYTNLALDKDGFIYATIGRYEGSREKTKPIRK
jgi:hypothetical protein